MASTSFCLVTNASEKAISFTSAGSRRIVMLLSAASSGSKLSGAFRTRISVWLFRLSLLKMIDISLRLVIRTALLATARSLDLPSLPDICQAFPPPLPQITEPDAEVDCYSVDLRSVDRCRVPQKVMTEHYVTDPAGELNWLPKLWSRHRLSHRAGPSCAKVAFVDIV